MKSASESYQSYQKYRKFILILALFFSLLSEICFGLRLMLNKYLATKALQRVCAEALAA